MYFIIMVCRICLDIETEANKFVKNSCKCKGSVANIHYNCLQKWIEISGKTKCEICLRYYNYNPEQVVRRRIQLKYERLDRLVNRLAGLEQAAIDEQIQKKIVLMLTLFSTVLHSYMVIPQTFRYKGFSFYGVCLLAKTITTCAFLNPRFRKNSNTMSSFVFMITSVAIYLALSVKTPRTIESDYNLIGAIIFNSITSIW